MTDHLLNNVRDIVRGSAGSTFQIEIAAHEVSDESAAEVVALLGGNFTWNSKAAGHRTQWLDGRTTADPDLSVTLFLKGEALTEGNRQRGRKILESVGATIDWDL